MADGNGELETRLTIGAGSDPDHDAVASGSEFEGVARHISEGVKGGRMRSYTAVIERCPETGLFVGYVPGFPGAHSQGQTLDELNRNLSEVIKMLLEDGEPKLEAEFVGTQTVVIE